MENNDKEKNKKKGLAITSLVCGIIGGVFSTISIVAIVSGHLALSRVKNRPDEYTGKGMAKAGLILGYLGLALGLAVGIMRGVVKNQLGL